MTNRMILISCTMFVGGVSTGYFIAKHVLKKQYQEGVAEVKDFYLAKLEEMGVMPSEFDPKDLEDRTENEDEEPYEASEEYLEAVKKYSSAATEASRGKGRPIIKYNKPPIGQIYDEYSRPDEEEEMTDEEDLEAYEAELEARAEEYAKARAEGIDNGRPYVIEFDEFEHGPDGYEKQYLYYYSQDRVLCEDDDSSIDEEEALVGLEYEDILDIQTAVWVRNDVLGTLYHIQRIDDSYYRSVANVVETPSERDFRIKGRRKQILD